MSLQDIVKQAQKMAVDNAPAILTAIGVTGTLTTAYLTGKASFKAARILDAEERRISLDRTGEEGNTFDIPIRDAAKLVWKQYIPAASTAVLTVSCIVYATRIGNRRAAAVAAAYTITEKAFSEYKEKVAETIGKNKAQKVHDDIAQDRVNAHPTNKGGQVIVVGGGDVLCYD